MVQSLMDFAPPETGLQPEEEDDEPKKPNRNGKRAVKEMRASFRLLTEKVFFFLHNSFSDSSGAEHDEAQPSERGEKHWSCRSAHDSHQNPHQPSQARSCRFLTFPPFFVRIQF